MECDSVPTDLAVGISKPFAVNSLSWIGLTRAVAAEEPTINNRPNLPSSAGRRTHEKADRECPMNGERVYDPIIPCHVVNQQHFDKEGRPTRSNGDRIVSLAEGCMPACAIFWNAALTFWPVSAEVSR